MGNLRFRLKLLAAFFSGAVAVAAPAWGATGLAVDPPDAPRSVTLFPRGAQVTVNRTVAVADGAIRFTLPKNVRKDSLQLNVDGRSVTRVSLTPEIVADSPEVAALRAALTGSKDQARALRSQLEANAAQMKVWTAQEVKLAGVDDLEKLDRLLGERMVALAEAKARLQQALEKTDAESREIERALEQGGARDGDVLLLTAEVTGPLSGEAVVDLTYVVGDCGWSPVYRLEAMPMGAPGRETSFVRVTQEADVYQASGADWSGVDLTLSTAGPGGRLEPAARREWRIALHNEPPGLRAASPGAGGRPGGRTLSENTLESPGSPSEEMASAYAPPVSEDFSTYTVWSLGKQDLASGRPSRMTLKQEDWDAEFTRIVRPALDPGAYLVAKVALEEPRHLPRGEASYVLEGRARATGSFEMTGARTAIFFGVDPRVTAEMKLVSHDSTRGGFIDRQQHEERRWVITVTNAHPRDVRVRVEDPEPRSLDEKVKIEHASNPNPVKSERNHQLIWDLYVPANGKQVITHEVKISAPKNMWLDAGR